MALRLYESLRGRSVAGTLAAAWLVTCAIPAGAAESPDQVRGWQETWAKTVAAGKQEGSIVLVVPASQTGRDYLQREWPKAYPDIKLELNTVQGNIWVQRVKTERSAGKYLWDAALTGSVVCYRMKDSGLLDPIQPELIHPDVKSPATWGGWEEAFFDNEHKYVFATRGFLKMPFYNAKLLAPEKVKQLGTKVFLDPALKGKVIWHDPLISGSGESFAPVFRRLLGDDGLTTFVQQQVVFNANMLDVVDKMARGQFTVGMGPVMTNLLKRYEKAGVDLDIRPLGNTPEFAAYGNTGGSNLIVVKDRPHPNALRVFLNWFLSKPVALEFAKAMGEDSRRTDAASVSPPDQARVPGVKYYEPQREEFEPDLQDAHKVIRAARKM
jgi:iron(III) transport system substrate-binding protein